MAPTLHLVRHAQGFHNLSVANQQMPDPLLTDLGKQQCAELRQRFPAREGVTHLVASPMRRTLYTCLLAFGLSEEAGEKSHEGAEKSGIVIALPELQEVSVVPSDVGSDRAVLEAEFGGRVDLSRVVAGWNYKGHGSPWAPDVDKLEARARTARRFLRDLVGQDGGDAVVVTHGGFLHFLTQDWDGTHPDQGEREREARSEQCGPFRR